MRLTGLQFSCRALGSNSCGLGRGTLACASWKGLHSSWKRTPLCSRAVLFLAQIPRTSLSWDRGWLAGVAPHPQAIIKCMLFLEGGLIKGRCSSPAKCTSAAISWQYIQHLGSKCVFWDEDLGDSSQHWPETENCIQFLSF